MYIITFAIEEHIFGEVGVLMAKTNSKYTEDWVPIKAIKNGMIQLDNDYYLI